MRSRAAVAAYLDALALPIVAGNPLDAAPVEVRRRQDVEELNRCVPPA